MAPECAPDVQVEWTERPPDRERDRQLATLIFGPGMRADATQECTDCGRSLPRTSEFFNMNPGNRHSVRRCKPCQGGINRGERETPEYVPEGLEVT